MALYGRIIEIDKAVPTSVPTRSLKMKVVMAIEAYQWRFGGCRGLDNDDRLGKSRAERDVLVL